MARTDILEKYTFLKDNEDFGKIINNSELSDEELEHQLYTLSCSQINDAIYEALREKTFKYTNWCGEVKDRQKYYLCDVQFDEKLAITEDAENHFNNYALPYTMNGDKAIIDFEKPLRYVRGDWRPYEGEDEISDNNNINIFVEEDKKEVQEAFEQKDKMLKDAQDNFNDMKQKYEDIEKVNKELTDKVNELTVFQENVKRNEIDNLINKYSKLNEIEGFSEIIKDKYSMDIKELEDKIKVFAYDNISKKNFELDDKINRKYDLDNVNSKPTHTDGKDTSEWDEILG